MTYSIIGTGNIAWFLAKRLTAAGHQCTGIYGRNEAAANELAGWIHTDIYSSIDEINRNSEDIDVCFLAVSDAAIVQTASQLSLGRTVLIHTAGSVNVNAISEAAEDTGVLWPVYSISKSKLPNHRSIPCAWETTTPRAQKYLLSIAHAITDVLFEAKSDQRLWMHLSAVISNNFTNHLMAICEQICTTHNIPFSILLPIIEQTFEQVKQSSPYKMQTGPARRSDITTINKHLSLLAPYPQWQDVYTVLTSSIEKMYHAKDEEKDVKS